MEAGWWGAPLTLLDLAKVTHKPCTNSRQSQIPLLLAASVRTNESLSISLATQDNLEHTLFLCSVDQHEKQKDEILQPPFVPLLLNITSNLPLCYLSTLPHLFHLSSTLPSQLFHFPIQYYPTFPSSLSSQWQIDHSKIATFLHSVDRANAYDQ